MALITALLALLGALLLLICVVLALEVAAAFLPAMAGAMPATGTPSRVAVLIPAHNEAGGIGATVAAILAQTGGSGRVLVVADNCSDATLALAQAAGATAIARTDPTRRGKGFALDFGVRHLAGDPPDIVILMDADCRADAGSLTRIAALALATQRPVQANYAMLLPEGLPSRGMAVAAFAWRVKNWVRPLGLHRLALPCQLMGTGIAVPWPLLARAKLGTAEIVEDLVLGLDFAREGAGPLFCPQARVISYFPANSQGQESQRTRWETGHLATITGKLPALMITALKDGNLPLLAMALDAAVPPLAFLAMLLAANLAVTALFWALAGAMLPLALALAACTLFAAAVAGAFAMAGGTDLPLAQLAAAPLYAVRKLGLYARFAAGRQLSWVRTKRD